MKKEFNIKFKEFCFCSLVHRCGSRAQVGDVCEKNEHSLMNEVEFYQSGIGSFFTSRPPQFGVETALGRILHLCFEASGMPFNSRVFTKLLAACFPPECAGSLSCSDGVSTCREGTAEAWMGWSGCAG